MRSWVKYEPLVSVHVLFWCKILNWLICLAHFQLKSLALTCCLEHDGTKEHGLSIKQGIIFNLFQCRRRNEKMNWCSSNTYNVKKTFILFVTFMSFIIYPLFGRTTMYLKPKWLQQKLRHGVKHSLSLKLSVQEIRKWQCRRLVISQSSVGLIYLVAHIKTPWPLTCNSKHGSIHCSAFTASLQQSGHIKGLQMLFPFHKMFSLSFLLSRSLSCSLSLPSSAGRPLLTWWGSVN